MRLIGEETMVYLVVNVRLNSLAADGRRHLFGTRWVASLAKALIQSGRRGLRREALAALLHQMGRGETSLNAKQAQRMLDALRNGLEALGGPELANRVQWPPGGKVNGPWTWLAKSSDRIEWADEPVSPLDGDFAPWGDSLPGFHTDPLSTSALRIAQEMKQVLAWTWDGDGDLLVNSLSDERLWKGCSAACTSLRWLWLGEHATAARKLELAETSLANAARALEHCDAITNGALGPVVETLRWRLKYHSNPVRHCQDVHRMALAGNHFHSRHEPVNVVAEINRLNLLMLCERRLLEQSSSLNVEEAKSMGLSIARKGHAALFLAVAASWMDRAQIVVANLAYAHQAIAKRFREMQAESEEERHLRLAVEWYAVALSYFTRFDLPENSAHEYIFLGELWQSHDRARQLFAEVAPRLPWLQHGPGEPAYYQHASALAKRLVTDRRNGATDVRRNGASNRWVERHPEGV
ncbi:MAG: hypothetical protein J0L58_19320 [Burkholderiales bacterium]|nr:hypothetical protein [Burkholderiales bacterium]